MQNGGIIFPWTLAETLHDYVIVDLRTNPITLLERIPGAWQIPLTHLELEHHVLPPGDVVAYDEVGDQTQYTAVVTAFTKIGRNVKILFGGFELWRRRGSPTESILRLTSNGVKVNNKFR